ncbi:hypothetical protein [Lysobacter sp. A3-1-A15]
MTFTFGAVLPLPGAGAFALLSVVVHPLARRVVRALLRRQAAAA